MLRLTTRVVKSPYTLAKYIQKNPKWNLAKVGLASYVGYKVYQYASSDALAFERIRGELQRQITDGAQTEMEDPGMHYHLEPLKQVLVMLNPAGAGGDSGKYFEQYIEPILMVSGFDIHVHKTTSIKDARDQAKLLLNDKFDAIIVVGGDGTLSEVITGIASRDDADEFFKRTPLAVIPTGKTNSTYRSYTIDQTQEEFFDSWRHEIAELAVHETNRVIKGIVNEKGLRTVHPMFKVQIKLKGESWEEAREKHQPVYAMDSVEWGIAKNWKERKQDLWGICPFKNFVARSREFTNAAPQKIEMDVQVNKREETIQEVQRSGGRLATQKIVTTQREIFEKDGTIEQTYDNFKIMLQHPEDEDTKYDKLELQCKNVLGEWYDFGMDEKILRETRGNRFRFHRAVLRRFEGSQQIYIDGTAYPLEDVEELELLHCGDKVVFIQ